MFKKLLVLLSMLAALAMSAVAFAAPAKSHQQMVIDAARAEVPAAAVFYGYKEEDGEAVLNFRDNDNYLEYEVEVVLATTKVKEVEIKGSNIAGSTMMVKTPEDIRQIVLEAYPDARNIVIKTEKGQEKCDQQIPDVKTVHVGVGCDNDLRITQIVDILLNIQSMHDIEKLFVRVNRVQFQTVTVQRLAMSLAWRSLTSTPHPMTFRRSVMISLLKILA